MEERIRNRLRMLSNVLGHFDASPALWTDVEPVAQEVARLRAANDALVDAGDDQAANDPEGLTAQKRKARADGAKKMAALSDKVTAYAVSIGDEDLRKAVDHSESEWARMAEADFASEARDALDRTEAHLASLAPYKVTAEEIAAARADVSQVGRLAQRRDRTGAARAVATDELPEVYSEEARPALLQLDRLVPTLIDDEPFVDEYRENRRIPGD